eukprot:c2595_g1_i1.p1 GENE.c2595_g1_i1~~c2595_g1_i1.p1  ORF type:complete len:137 (+),score=21.03 c2595_g1_i1:270-680(+)
MAAPPPTPQADAVNIRFLMIDNYLLFRSFAPQTSLAEIKAMLASAWPADKKPSPPAHAMRIVYCGQLLEDNILLNQTRAAVGPHWVTMHLWPKFQAQASNPAKKADGGPTKSGSAGANGPAAGGGGGGGGFCCVIL